MESGRGRRGREGTTLSAMIRLYCASRHGRKAALCRDCARLEAYARARLERCRFGAGKPVCALCPVHCYRPSERERIRAVMRFAGPRMALRHPLLAVLHLLHRARGARVRAAPPSTLPPSRL